MSPTNSITTIAELEQALPDIAASLAQQLAGALRLLHGASSTSPADFGVIVAVSFSGGGSPFKITLALGDPDDESDAGCGPEGMEDEI